MENYDGFFVTYIIDKFEYDMQKSTDTLYFLIEIFNVLMILTIHRF